MESTPRQYLDHTKTGTYKLEITPNTLVLHLEKHELRSTIWIDVLQGNCGYGRCHKSPPNDCLVVEEIELWKELSYRALVNK